MARSWLSVALAAWGVTVALPAAGKPAASPAPDRVPRIEVSILNTGTLKNLEAVFCETGSWLRMRQGTIMAVLVRHPRGTFLFDAGYGAQAKEQYALFPWWARPLVDFRQSADTASILRHGGIQPKDIRWIIPSHMHWDHASAIKDFPGAEVWVTRPEYDFAHRTPPPRVVRQQFDQGVRWRIFAFANRPYENFRQSLDLFGDGSLVLVPLPGHTPGGVGLFANLTSGKRLFFTGDTTWLVEGFQHRAGKSWLASMMVDSDRDLTHRSLLQVADLMKQKPEIVVVPAHDARVQADLAHFPRYEQ